MILEQAAQENWNQRDNFVANFFNVLLLGNQKLAKAREIGVLQTQVSVIKSSLLSLLFFFLCYCYYYYYYYYYYCCYYYIIIIIIIIIVIFYYDYNY
jgi:hypothetical protein